MRQTRSSRRPRVRHLTWQPRHEPLEPRVVLAAGMAYDRNTRVLTIVGSETSDVVEVRQQGANVVVSMRSGSAQMSRTVAAATVGRIAFTGLAGNDSFTNLTAIASRADGGPGADVLRGGRAADELIGGDGDDSIDGGLGIDTVRGDNGNDVVHGGGGNDTVSGGVGNDDLFGGAGNDVVDAGKGDDRLDGELGSDRLVGGEGLDRETDGQDRFADGDADGDGYDNDYDAFDILYESPGNPPAYANDAAAAPTIALVTAELCKLLQIPADDPGLRVRVSANRFGDLVTGVWRYMTPDKIQVWAKWCYPASNPAKLTSFAQYEYSGPYSGNIADYVNPAYYSISSESRIYAGYVRGPQAFIGWLPDDPVGFFYSAPNQQATGYPAPIEQLTTALGSLPGFTVSGDSFSGNLSEKPGFQGLKPVVDLLRSINQVNRTWYAQSRTR